MTKDGGFKKVVRRHARDTGRRYTEALADLEGMSERLFHEPEADRVISHLRDTYGVCATGARQLSQHNNHVWRIDRSDGDPWVARIYPPARPRAGVEGDAAILRFLGERDYPAERLAAADPVSDLDGASMVVTTFVEGENLPSGVEKISMIGDLLGRLHALDLDDSVDRPGGAAGDDARHEGSPDQDLVAALGFLDAVDTKVAPESRSLFEQLRGHVLEADAGNGLPVGVLHGNLLHDPDHAVLTDDGPVVINWKAAGVGPRVSDLAYLLWGAEWGDGDGVAAAIGAYRKHVTLVGEELDRLEAVMCVRPLYLACLDFRRAVLADQQPTGDEWWWGLIDPAHIARNAAAARAAFTT